MQAGEQGFTLIELVVAITIAAVLLVVVSDFEGINLLNSNTDYTKTLLLNNTKLATDTVTHTVHQAKSVEAANTQPDANSPGAPGNLYSWNGQAGTSATLILAVPARDSSNNLIYVDGLHDNLYTDDYVYYLDSSTHRLYRRIIANQSAPGNRAVTTCPPSKASPSCPADADVVDDVANLSIGYLDSNNNSVASPTGTEAVQFTLTETKTIGTSSYKSSYTSIAELRNK